MGASEVKEDIVRVFRILEYVGKRSWVEDTIRDSIHGERRVTGGGTIKAATLGVYPEIMQDVIRMDESK